MKTMTKLGLSFAFAVMATAGAGIVMSQPSEVTLDVASPEQEGGLDKLLGKEDYLGKDDYLDKDDRLGIGQF